MISRRSIPIMAVLALTGAGVLAASATDVIERAQTADDRVSYRGMKTATIYSRRGVVESSMKVLHLRPNLTRTEYYTPSALAGIIVVETATDMWRFDPREKVWEQVCTGLAAPADHTAGDLSRNYDVRLVGSDRVAGRSAYVIHAVPKHPGDAVRRLWIDKQFYLIVANQVENGYGRVINSSRYTSIDFNPGDISASAFKVDGNVRNKPDPPSSHFKLVQPTYLPKGYRLLGASWMCVNGRSCAHLQYSNGANTISLFERQDDGGAKSKSPLEGHYTNVLSWSRQGMVFTLISNVPKSELQKIADSVK